MSMSLKTLSFSLKTDSKDEIVGIHAYLVDLDMNKVRIIREFTGYTGSDLAVERTHINYHCMLEDFSQFYSDISHGDLSNCIFKTLMSAAGTRVFKDMYNLGFTARDISEESFHDSARDGYTGNDPLEACIYNIRAIQEMIRI
jgi:hypothetical protein